MFILETQKSINAFIIPREILTYYYPIPLGKYFTSGYFFVFSNNHTSEFSLLVSLRTSVYILFIVFRRFHNF